MRKAQYSSATSPSSARPGETWQRLGIHPYEVAVAIHKWLRQFDLYYGLYKYTRASERQVGVEGRGEQVASFLVDALLAAPIAPARCSRSRPRQLPSTNS